MGIIIIAIFGQILNLSVVESGYASYNVGENGSAIYTCHTDTLEGDGLHTHCYPVGKEDTTNYTVCRGAGVCQVGPYQFGVGAQK